MEAMLARCRAISVGVLVLIASAVSTAFGAEDIWNARLRFPSDGGRILYVQVRSTGQLRLADSPAALTTATPVAALDRTQHQRGTAELSQHFTFPEVNLPVSLPHVDKVSAIISLGRDRGREGGKGPITDTTAISARFSMSRREAAGGKWVYLTTVETPRTPTSQVAGVTPEQAPILELPDLAEMRLTVETKIEGTKARIGLRVKAGAATVDKVLKNGRNATCGIQVLDAAGKVLHSATGDLEKFGFT